MNPTTKFCKGCGKIMWDVTPQRRLCDACRSIPPEERGKPKPVKRAKKRPKKKKSLSTCIKEAAALGISYGKYVERGLDRKELKL